MNKRDSDGMSEETSSPSSAFHNIPLSSSASTAQTSLELTSPTTYNSFNPDITMSSDQPDQDDFLGTVSRWGKEEDANLGTGRRGDGIRLSKMIGSTFGPPSRPPPAAAPPPLPPIDAAGSRPPRPHNSPLNRATLTLSTSHPPALPPPSGALPALPTAPPPSTPVKETTSRSRQSSLRKSATPPPRTTSLLSPAQLLETDPTAGPSSIALSIPSTSNGSSSTSPSSPLRSSHRPPRTPSRHLLQTALDLAQRAVEMDKNNDVLGALEAYREAVSRLKSVMDRVGVEPGKDDGRKKRNANGKAEEEGRTLKGIHDAYVARIQLLISYETGDQPPSSKGSSPESFLATTHPSTSTATLVPKSPPHSPQAGERTPRPSLDDTTREFGELALNVNDDTIRPGASLSSPFAAPREDASQSSSNMGVQAPARMALQNLDPPESPTSTQSHDAMSPASSTKSRSIRRKPARPSMGLENELDLQISENEEEMEVLERTPQLGSSSRMAAEAHSPSRLPDALDTDRPLPPLPSSASTRSTGSHEGQPKIHARHASLGKNMTSMLVSPSTALGTISQRRQKSTMEPPMAGQDLQQVSGIDGLPPGGTTFPSRTSSTGPSALSSIFPPRLRTRSQPGRPGAEDVPPLPTPTIRHKGSFGSHRKSSMASLSRGFKNGSEGSRLDASSLAPPPSSSPLSSISRSLGPPSVASASGSLMSPLPESQPNELIHRPFHLLRLLQRSMDPNSSGSYLTGKIHISSAVWKPAIWPKTASGTKALGPPKIVGQEAKVRIMESLIINIGIISRTGLALLDGPREFRSDGSEGLVDPNLSRAMGGVAEELCAALDALEDEMDASHKLLTKNGVTVGAWKGKKSGSAKSWGSKFTKTMDKITNTKAVESPDRYVDLLYNFCAHIQVIGDHLSCVVGPCTQNYSSLPDRSFNELKSRLLTCSDFISVVVVPWLLDDFKQFFLRYLKGGVRYMEE